MEQMTQELPNEVEKLEFKPVSEIIESIKLEKESEQRMGYEDHCDWHDTCDCNE